MKNKIMLLSLLAPMLLVNCGSKDIDYTVTEQEFNDALDFKGVKYLQIVEGAASKAKPEEFMPIRRSVYMPDAMSWREYDEEEEFPNEYRYFKKGSTYFQYHRFIDADWDLDKMTEKPYYYETIEEDVVKAIHEAWELGIEGYKDFVYEDAKKAYCLYFVPEGYTKQMYVALHFENKKVVSLDTDYDSEGMGGLIHVATYSYDKENIEEPTIPEI
ncbi:MAG: hypothetical protein MJ206_03780 [Bacilli bacterium]|nr:hypothetical protein [Bacilli bacterium]